jgi:hypothetical protein
MEVSPVTARRYIFDYVWEVYSRPAAGAGATTYCRSCGSTGSWRASIRAWSTLVIEGFWLIALASFKAWMKKRAQDQKES